METAAIYGLSTLLGHNALSLNAIIANRASRTFSADPYKAVDELIGYTLDRLAKISTLICSNYLFVVLKVLH
jgi:uridine phosphorylase